MVKGANDLIEIQLNTTAIRRLGVDKVSIEDLLEKNPKAKEVFEENAKKLGSRHSDHCKRKEYGLALPYDGLRLWPTDGDDAPSPSEVANAV